MSTLVLPEYDTVGRLVDEPEVSQNTFFSFLACSRTDFPITNYHFRAIEPEFMFNQAKRIYFSCIQAKIVVPAIVTKGTLNLDSGETRRFLVTTDLRHRNWTIGTIGPDNVAQEGMFDFLRVLQPEEIQIVMDSVTSTTNSFSYATYDEGHELGYLLPPSAIYVKKHSDTMRFTHTPYAGIYDFSRLQMCEGSREQIRLLNEAAALTFLESMTGALQTIVDAKA